MSDAAVILAAGKGKRMRSARPKVLHEVGGHPLIAYPVSLATSLSLAPVCVVIGHGGEQVREYLGQHFDGSVELVWQKQQLGTGHAVQVALEQLDTRAQRVAILSGDVPFVQERTLKALRRAYDTAGGPLAMVTVQRDDPGGYGRIVRDAKGAVTHIVEHKDATPEERRIGEINAGVYLVHRAFLQKALASLGRNNRQGEVYLTDVVARAASEGRVATVDATAEETQGINTREELAAAEAVLRKRVISSLMARGVTVIDPAYTYVDPVARLGRDVVLHPGVHIQGPCVIGAGAVIEAGAVIIASAIGAGARIRPYSHIEQARVDGGAVVGPFARLRPKAHVGANAEVGNFCELKNTRLGRGAKSHHVSYLGDAEIADGVNIGAGTITCNYDGHKKHPTVIGKGAFVGSNSTLVAPLTIGAGAYIGAGSTVNRDVPADALALGRARQENKDGYAALLRRRLSASREKK